MEPDRNPRLRGRARTARWRLRRWSWPEASTALRRLELAGDLPSFEAALAQRDLLALQIEL